MQNVAMMQPLARTYAAVTGFPRRARQEHLRTIPQSSNLQNWRHAVQRQAESRQGSNMADQLLCKQGCMVQFDSYLKLPCRKVLEHETLCLIYAGEA